MFVLDNSVTAAWCFEDQSTPYTDAVLLGLVNGSTAIVPAIWKLEVVNSLVVAERRRKLTQEKSGRFLEELNRLSIVVDARGLDLIFTSVLDLARRHQRSAYDASYLELALRLGLPLATKDEPLRKAAEELQVSLFVA